MWKEKVRERKTEGERERDGGKRKIERDRRGGEREREGEEREGETGGGERGKKCCRVIFCLNVPLHNNLHKQPCVCDKKIGNFQRLRGD